MSVDTTAPTRRLQIIGCEQITEGATNDGRTWRLFKVRALDRRGAPIGAELRSFDQLEPGLTDDFRVERREHERYGVSYLIRRNRGRVGDRVAELERQGADHEKRIAALEAAPPY